jgi:hypothetical protein
VASSSAEMSIPLRMTSKSTFAQPSVANSPRTMYVGGWGIPTMVFLFSHQVQIDDQLQDEDMSVRQVLVVESTVLNRFMLDVF